VTGSAAICVGSEIHTVIFPIGEQQHFRLAKKMLKLRMLQAEIVASTPGKRLRADPYIPRPSCRSRLHSPIRFMAVS
jgi:hypothetical protein